MSSPFFTIATITYNSERWVRQAIDSILTSTFDNFELIISDDCSTDGTWNIIQSYVDPRIRSFKNEDNIGEYPNRNKVLEFASGTFIFYIDGDDILYKNSLQNLYNFLTCFPDAGMVWGIFINEIDFAVFPYQFSPEQITRLIYFTINSISFIGLAETVFNIECLKAVGGFKTHYAIGDTYIKRKLALTNKVLLVPAGFAFWRQSIDQASKKAKENFKSYIDLHFINQEIMTDKNLPLTLSEKKIAKENIRISEIKLLISTILFKGKIRQFFSLWKKLRFGINDIKFLFKKGMYNFKPVQDISQPLMNNYNFKKGADTSANIYG